MCDCGLQDQLLKLSPDIQNADRFVQVRSPSSPEVTAALAATGHNRAVCVKYGGTVGGKWPTIQVCALTLLCSFLCSPSLIDGSNVQRGHWFSNQGDVESFREKIRMACPLSASSKKTKKYKLVLYQRDLSRKLLYQDDALQMIHSILNPQLWEVQVLMHSSSRSPCALYEIIHDTDVLLTPHGFQSMLLILMAPKKLLFEVFPYRYFKPAYSPFGREFDVFHGGVMSEGTSWLSDYIFRYVTTPTCMQIKQCRVHSRDQDVM